MKSDPSNANGLDVTKVSLVSTIVNATSSCILIFVRMSAEAVSVPLLGWMHLIVTVSDHFIHAMRSVYSAVLYSALRRGHGMSKSTAAFNS